VRKRRIAAPERILEAAEQLFARRGIDRVSLLDIVGAAGQRNTSAVQYHFGSKQHLIEAIFEARERTINPHRLALLAEIERNGRATDLRSLVEAMVYSLAAAVKPGSCYARFVAQALYDPVRRRVLRKDVPVHEGSRRIEARILAALRDLPPAVRHQRFRLAWRLLVQTLALHERELETLQRPLMSTAALAAELVESIVAMLRAPLAPVRRGRHRRPRPRRRHPHVRATSRQHWRPHATRTRHLG